MSAADLERVLEIAGRLQQAPDWPVAAYAAAMNPENTPRRIALVATDPESDTPTGFLVTVLLAPEAELETIAVVADGQRRGIGGLLLRALAEGLRTEHISDLVLEVRSSNRTALEFYKAQGFAETGRRQRYYADPEEDAVLMRLKLA
jgi:ribosomal-protein-alanine acetyltransferase